MEKVLRQFNFSNPQIAAYKALLSSGGALVSEIAEMAGIKRTSCAEYLRDLQERGFVNASRIGNKYYYQAEDPDKFRQIVHERQYIVDRLLGGLGKMNRKKKSWKVGSVALDYVRKAKKRWLRKNRIIFNYGCDNASIISSANTILLSSSNEDIPAIKIESEDLVDFHKDILKKFI